MERPGSILTVVATDVPADRAAASAAIARLFTSKKSLGRFARFSVAEVGNEAFPNDYQIEHYKDQPALQQYVRIPPQRRGLDLYIYDFSDADDRNAYWASEYSCRGAPAPFRCNFLVHVGADGTGRSQVALYEVAPRVWVGRKFSFEAHGPGMYLDVRPVAPTTGDRRELLALITRAVGP